MKCVSHIHVPRRMKWHYVFQTSSDRQQICYQIWPAKCIFMHQVFFHFFLSHVRLFSSILQWLKRGRSHRVNIKGSNLPGMQPLLLTEVSEKNPVLCPNAVKVRTEEMSSPSSFWELQNSRLNHIFAVIISWCRIKYIGESIVKCPNISLASCYYVLPSDHIFHFTIVNKISFIFITIYAIYLLCLFIFVFNPSFIQLLSI